MRQFNNLKFQLIMDINTDKVIQYGEQIVKLFSNHFLTTNYEIKYILEASYWNKFQTRFKNEGVWNTRGEGIWWNEAYQNYYKKFIWKHRKRTQNVF